MLVQHDLHPISVSVRCEQCSGGQLLPAIQNTSQMHSTAFQVNPPAYEHKCNKCGHTLFFTEAFPILRWVRKGETLNIHQSQFEREPVKLDPHRTAGTMPC